MAHGTVKPCYMCIHHHYHYLCPIVRTALKGAFGTQHILGVILLECMHWNTAVYGIKWLDSGKLFALIIGIF